MAWMISLVDYGPNTYYKVKVTYPARYTPSVVLVSESTDRKVYTCAFETDENISTGGEVLFSTSIQNKNHPTGREVTLRATADGVEMISKKAKVRDASGGGPGGRR